MVKVPAGYRSKNVQDRRTGGGGSLGGGINAGDLLGGMLGGNATGGGALGSILGSGALTSILGSLLGGGRRSAGGGLLGSILGGMLGGGGRSAAEAARNDSKFTDDDRENANDEAVILIRAMINAAKADGQIDKEEVQNIVSRLGEIDKNEAAFLENELKAPLDLDAFCRSVPEDMSEQTYAFSVMGMRLDTQQEAHYLGEVAEGLDLDAATCNAIHDKLGVPKIFR